MNDHFGAGRPRALRRLIRRPIVHDDDVIDRDTNARDHLRN
jgi:hypothetical protein